MEFNSCVEEEYYFQSLQVNVLEWIISRASDGLFEHIASSENRNEFSSLCIQTLFLKIQEHKKTIVSLDLNDNKDD